MNIPRDFLEAMALIMSTYPEREFPEETVKSYWYLLKDIPLPEIKLAVVSLLSTQEAPFPPKPAEIRRQAADLHLAHIADEYTAWEEVMRAIKDVGMYRIPEWSSPIIGMAVTSVGGFQTLCLSKTDQLGIVRAHFWAAYRAYRNREYKNYIQLPEVRDYFALTPGQGESDV